MLIGWDDFLKYFGAFMTLIISSLGVPIPEEIPIITGGILCASAYGNPESGMYWWIMLPTLIVGVVVGDCLIYWVGRRYGTRLLEWKWIRTRVLPPDKRVKIETNFHQYGVMILLVARMLPGIRTPIFLMAGILKLPFRKFMLADGLYAIPGVNLFFWLSYWFTDQFKAVFDRVQHSRPLIIAVVLAGVGGFFLNAFLRRRIATGDPASIPVIGKKVASHIGSGGPLSDVEQMPTDEPVTIPLEPEPPKSETK